MLGNKAMAVLNNTKSIKKKLKFIPLHILLLLIILSIGIYLRIAVVSGPEGLWYDDLNTYFIAKQAFPMGIIKSLLIRDMHLPLYYFFIHFWINLFGNSDIALKFSSALFAILTLPISYLAGKELSGIKGGLITICFFSINSGLIYFSQEVRFYTALAFFSTLVILFLIRIRNNPTKANYIGLIISNLLIMYTFTIGCMFVFIEMLLFLAYLIYKRENKKYFLFSILIMFILSVPNIILLVCLSIKNFNLVYNYFDYYQFRPLYLLNIIKSIAGPMIPLIWIPLYEQNIFLTSSAVLIFFIFVIKTITKKDFVLILFLIGLMPFLIQLTLGIEGKFAFTFNHAMLSVPFFIISASYGLSQFKNKIVFYILLTAYITVNLSYLFFDQNSLLNKRKFERYNFLAQELSARHATKQDVLIIVPFGGSAVTKYDYSARLASFCLTDYCFESGESFKYIFNRDFVKSLNKNNVYYKLKDFAYSQKPTSLFKNYLLQEVGNTIPKNRYIFVAMPNYIPTLYCPYKNGHVQNVVKIKIIQDLLNILSKNDKFTQEKLVRFQGWNLYIFKRI